MSSFKSLFICDPFAETLQSQPAKPACAALQHLQKMKGSLATFP